MKFVIVSPRNNSGGALVLKELCTILNKHGHVASLFLINGMNYAKRRMSVARKIFAFQLKDIIRERNIRRRGKEYYKNKKEYKNNLNTDYSGQKIKRFPFVDKDTIVIYPEKIYGNPLHSKKVVRYLLYYNPHKDNNWHEKNDLFLCFRKQFNDWELNPNGLQLNIRSFDTELYKRYNYGSRSGKCYIIRKGRNRPDLPAVFDGVVIDNLEEKEKVMILNECEDCISYDTQTFYSAIATICGCRSIIIPDPGKSRSDYLTDEDQAYGRSFGYDEDELKYAKDTAHLVLENILESQRRSDENVTRFEKMCDKYFFQNCWFSSI